MQSVGLFVGLIGVLLLRLDYFNMVVLASYLGTIKAMESTECSCGRGIQDTRHILLHCTNKAGPRMRHLTQGSRRELDHRVRRIRRSLRGLIRGSRLPELYEA